MSDLSNATNGSKLQVGILGFGALGQHMYDAISSDPAIARFMQVSFVWNRSAAALEGLPAEQRCTDLEEVPGRGADIVVEVSHPSITVAMAARVIAAGGNFVCGSPTCFADPAVEAALRTAAAAGNGAGKGAMYVPVGALWGAADLQAMANRGALASLTITMKKHPAMVNFSAAAAEAGLTARAKALLDIEAASEVQSQGQLQEQQQQEEVLYEGPVRGLCPLCPNNVNTMACCAMAAHTLGFDGTCGACPVLSSLSCVCLCLCMSISASFSIP